jgi:hypothetical protein
LSSEDVKERYEYIEVMVNMAKKIFTEKHA